MQSYFIENGRRTRDDLLRLTREYLESLIEKVSTAPRLYGWHTVEVPALQHLISRNLLQLDPIPNTIADGTIVDAGKRKAVIIFDPPPMGTVSLMTLPDDRPAWHQLRTISLDALLSIVDGLISELDSEIHNLEYKYNVEAPARRQEQRTEITGLMQKLAEARTLSFMGKLELNRATMNLIGNLEREIREEIGKAIKKD